jgi:hypothetical protein
MAITVLKTVAGRHKRNNATIKDEIAYLQYRENRKQYRNGREKWEYIQKPLGKGVTVVGLKVRQYTENPIKSETNE